MDKLTAREEDIIRVLWRLKKAFVNDIIEELPEPKPHYNTISTLVRKMEDKGFVGHKSYGKTHQYFPLVSEEQHKTGFMQHTVKHYFNNSYKNLVTFFAQKEKISAKELKEILEIIEKQSKS